MNQSFCGGMMGRTEKVSLCTALQKLYNEHTPLRKQMEEFYVVCKELKQIDEKESGSDKWKDLVSRVTTFESELSPHSEREEGILFPMMARYIGRETGPIAVMEYEHDQAKGYLRAFLNEAPHQADADTQRKIQLADFAIQAFLILRDHFHKEENILFPMAEQFLTNEEKEELGRLFNKQ